jgi:hypothetical protein
MAHISEITDLEQFFGAARNQCKVGTRLDAGELDNAQVVYSHVLERTLALQRVDGSVLAWRVENMDNLDLLTWRITFRHAPEAIQLRTANGVHTFTRRAAEVALTLATINQVSWMAHSRGNHRLMDLAANAYNKMMGAKKEDSIAAALTTQERRAVGDYLD